MGRLDDREDPDDRNFLYDDEIEELERQQEEERNQEIEDEHNQDLGEDG